MVAVATFGGIAAEKSPPAAASHFRADSTVWRLVDPATNTVEFTLVTSFRASYGSFGITAVGQTFSEGSLDYGDGNSGPITWTAVSLDTVNDVVTGQAVLTHSYASTGPFTVEMDNCCRLDIGDGHMNNGGGDIIVRSVIDLSNSTGGPISAISPIVGCAENALCSFTIPAIDPDGAQLRFRLATSSDGFGNQPAGAAIDPNSGLYTWDTTGAMMSSGPNTFYSTQVIIEKLIGGVVVGSSAVDFFIRVGVGTGGSAPYFDPPTPADAEVLLAPIGVPFSFDVHAHDNDTGDIITLGLLNKPAAATFTQHATPAGHGEATFSWTPTVAGDHFVVLTAQDQTGLSATQRSILIRVGTAANITAVDDAYATPVDTPLSISAPGVLSNDLAPVSAALVTGPSNGTVTLSADGSFTYTPGSGFVGTDQFTYTAGAGSNTATVSITVERRGPGFIPGPGGQGTTTTVPSSTTSVPDSSTTTEPGSTTTEPGSTTTEPGPTTTEPGGVAPTTTQSTPSTVPGGTSPSGARAPLARTGMPLTLLVMSAFTMIGLGGVIIARDRRRQAA